jgi:hypothetical protein
MPDAIDYQALADALIQRSAGLTAAHKAVSSTPTTTYGHGPGGLFSNPALERPIFSAMIMPRNGIEARLPLRATNFESPLYGIMTGVTATTGSEATGPCDDPPVAGLMKLCSQTAYLGRYARMSRVFEVDRMGLLESRGEHTDFQFVGNPFNGANNANLAAIPGAQGLDGSLNNEIGKATFELGVAMRRDFAKKVYTGNPTNNTASNGYQEFRGLDLLINTGYRDAVTGVACAAADSIVVSFGNRDVADAGAALVEEITSIYRNLKYIASGAGLDPVKWAITMSWGMFYEITEVWPCAYSTYRCTNLATGSTNFVDGAEMIRMRDEMRGNIYDRSGQYLLIDGERVEVVIDDGITEDAIGAGTQQSTIYFIPLTVLGGTPATYLEYLNYDAPNGALASARLMAPEGSYMTSDNGRFLWHKKPPTNFCVQFLVKTETRIIMRTPYLAARLTNVRFTPLRHQRQPFTDDPYFTNGGQTSYSGYGPSYYSPTS